PTTSPLSCTSFSPRLSHHPPPRPFPYTTLFRSPAAPAPGPADWRPVIDEEVARLPAAFRDALVLCDLQGLGRAEAAARLGVAEGDRKSTRLNSSHSQISYAVFCLKKKKKLNASR